MSCSVSTTRYLLGREAREGRVRPGSQLRDSVQVVTTVRVRIRTRL